MMSGKETAMESNDQDDFICPICGAKMIWLPLSNIFACDYCQQSIAKDAKYYLLHRRGIEVGKEAMQSLPRARARRRARAQQRGCTK